MKALPQMKNLLIIAVLILMPALGFAQSTVTNNDAIEEVAKEEVSKTTIESPSVKETKLNSQLKSQLIELNQKKSNDIISIKAYRKSLQIKTKEVKLC
jgi:hypothetical protein